MPLNSTVCGVADTITIPSLVIFYILFVIINLITGLSIVKSRQKFMLIWGLTLIFGLIVLIGICLMPNTIIQVTDWFKGLAA